MLRDEGETALTLERLCAALGCTKGSFYHHFADTSQLYEAMFERWRVTQTDAVIAAAATPGKSPPPQRLHARVVGLDHKLERALRAWALRDERARKAVARIDDQRVAFLSKMHADAGTPDAPVVAELEYLVFLGAQQRGVAGRSRRGADLAALFDLLVATRGRRRT